MTTGSGMANLEYRSRACCLQTPVRRGPIDRLDRLSIKQKPLARCDLAVVDSSLQLQGPARIGFRPSGGDIATGYSVKQ